MKESGEEEERWASGYVQKAVQTSQEPENHRYQQLRVCVCVCVDQLKRAAGLSKPNGKHVKAEVSSSGQIFRPE